MRDRLVATALVVLGLAAMAADLAGLRTVQAIAVATGASPAPKVFSSVQGLETFSTRFSLEWTDVAGDAHAVPLTPELYARLRGPYNRRNVYGAALAYAPVLDADPATSGMFRQVMRHALCGDAPLLREIGIDPARVASPVTVRLDPERPDALAPGLRLAFTVACP